MIDLDEGTVANIQLVQSNEVPNSHHMEKAGLVRSVEFFRHHNIPIKTIITDGHKMIAKWIREQMPETTHHLDVWHVAKEKDCKDLQPWIKSIVNNLYWTAASSTGQDPDVIVAKWYSINNKKSMLDRMMLSNITSSLTSEESNYLRLAHLVIRVSPEAVRKRFDHHFNRGGLQTILMMHKARIEVLFNKKIINQSQLDILYPSSIGSSVSSSDMDVTLMICLLRNIAKIRIQDVLPTPSDTSECADLSRIKFYRNYIAHTSDGKVNDSVYSEMWHNVCEAIARLGGQTLKDECDALKLGKLDCSLREIYMQLCKTVEMEEKVKDLERELMHPIPKSLRGNIDQQMEDWIKDDFRYIKTSSMTVILEKLRNNSFVVITGSPGIGKTITSRNICLKLRDIDGYTILPIRDPAKILEYSNKEIKLVYFIDDFCGTFALEQFELNNWIRYYPEIIRCLSESKCTKILATCRFQVLKTKPLEMFLKKSASSNVIYFPKN
ncbi:unnamed protein product [Mytilus coruscus]|uniref:Uncharacterized protein n=1 Tax=Mytilus coruscus TaxID=42192 RepID=A0A6J8CX93_MYTCO|nr:unnamed protein product [Mytilus coruscus]